MIPFSLSPPLSTSLTPTDAHLLLAQIGGGGAVYVAPLAGQAGQVSVSMSSVAVIATSSDGVREQPGTALLSGPSLATFFPTDLSVHCMVPGCSTQGLRCVIPGGAQAGGAVFAADGTALSLSQTFFFNTTSQGGCGGAVRAASLNASATAFWLTSAVGNGGAACAQSLSAAATSFTATSATVSGGGAYVPGNVSLVDSSFAATSAAYGGAVYGQTVTSTRTNFARTKSKQTVRVRLSSVFVP